MSDITDVIEPKIAKKPKWIRVKLPTGKKYTELRSLVDKYKLNTICSSGSCPNMGECCRRSFWPRGGSIWCFHW